MTGSLLTFPKGGIHPNDAKGLTHALPVEEMPAPKEVRILLSQHFGAPAEAVVKKKQELAEGECIGVVEKGLGASIHSSVAGTVTRIGPAPHPTRVKDTAITIATNAHAPQPQRTPCNWRDVSREELLARIQRAGIVGMGGAGFPTHVKLTPPSEAGVDKLILNGVECEPYLTNDHRLMLEHPDEILEGAEILLSVLGIRECHIGIEANKLDAVEVLAQRTAGRNGFQVHPLKVKYPQGSEKQLIQTITGRRVPGFGLPFDVGVIVQNVATTHAVYEAVALEKPLYEKIITVSGRGIQRPANLRVRIGTPLQDIISHLGGTRPELAKVVFGGPMTGFAVPDPQVPITKTTSGVLFLTEEEIDTRPHGPCIRCGWCLEACPMGLSPNEIGIYVEAGRGSETAPFGLFDCFECGCCAYVCPSHRPLVQFIRLAKSEAKR